MNDYHLLLVTDKHFLPYTFVACQSVIDSIGINKPAPLLVHNEISNQPTTPTDSSCLTKLDSGIAPAINNGVEPSITPKNLGYDNDRLIFHIMVDHSVDCTQLAEKAKVFSERNASAIPHEMIIHQVEEKLFKKCKPWGKQKSYGIYYRLLIDQILDQSISTVLYLDVDILVRADIRQLFHRYSLDNQVLGACLDMIAQQPGTSDGQTFNTKPSLFQGLLNNYFNSGILLINLQEWRRLNIGKQCIDILQRHDFEHPDQDALNYVVEKPVLLEQTWNCQIIFFYHQLLQIIPQDKLQKLPQYSLLQSYTTGSNRDYSAFITAACPNGGIDLTQPIVFAPAIVHFIMGSSKPWHINYLNFYGEAIYPHPQALVLALNEWYTTAARVSEFPELQRFTPISYNDSMDLYVVETRKSITAFEKRITQKRRRERKYFLAALAILFIIQIMMLIFR